MSQTVENPEMAQFNSALRKIMRVSKTELTKLVEQDKVTPLVPQKRGRKPKVSAPVFHGKD